MYNLCRGVGREPQISGIPTFFQQKWAAKSKTRAYHGEHIPEKKWVRLFSPRLLSVVDMPPQYLAQHDGSEQAAGRGSGLSTSLVTAGGFSKAPKLSKSVINPERRRRGGDVNAMLAEKFSDMTPYMQMTYAPLERRLDTAIFRAMFATSVRQARQFVIHGAVTVNGKKVSGFQICLSWWISNADGSEMTHPSYQLNPGDMFQVEVEKVLYATGKQNTGHRDSNLKTHKRDLQLAKERHEDYVKQLVHEQASPEIDLASTAESEAAAEGEPTAEEAKPENQEETASEEGAATEVAESLSEEDVWKVQHDQLRSLGRQVKTLLGEANPRMLTGKDKIALRQIRTEVKRLLSLPEGGEVDIEELMSELQLLVKTREPMREALQQFAVFQREGPEKERIVDYTNASKSGLQRTQEKWGENGRVLKHMADLTDAQKNKAMEIIKDQQLSNQNLRDLAKLLKKEEENPVDPSKPYLTPWEPRPFMNAFAFIPRYLEVNPNICAAVYLRHPVARRGMAEVPTPFSYLTNQLAHNWYLQRG